ncbi:hypothetical protein DLM45_00505 [Hyphomicrobium methylovorum]|nr:hypothetical protein [Hyphomicrobium methylovorum]
MLVAHPAVSQDAAPSETSAPALTGPAAIISARLAPTVVTPFDEADRDAVAAFYSKREFRPVWVDERGPTHAARLAATELGHAGEWGLDPAAFALPSLSTPMSQGRWTDVETADAELELTAAILRYAHQAQGSRIADPTTTLSSYIDRAPVVTNAADILAAVSSSTTPDALLRAYQPQQSQFLKLKALLAELRGSERSTPDITRIARRGPTLNVGDRSAEVALLRKQLSLSATPETEQLFDSDVAKAVKAFQRKASLRGDGIVGPKTRAILAGDRPDGRKTADRVAAVIANMEAWRWMPRDMGETNILVNIPAFSIRLTSKNETLFEDRVIVGTNSTQTPLFSKDMKTIVLRPVWNIPDSIKVAKLLSGRSIESQGYTVMRNGRKIDSSRVNWAKANLSAYTFYQPSGDDNALGLVKFLFPNKHAVYLHDTPSRSLFNSSERLYSHGCVRVRNPQKLAQRIFDIDRSEGALNVAHLVRKGPMNDEETLVKPFPVHVGYFTVWVGKDGEAQYFKDVYGHQRRIELALAGKWQKIDVGKDHLAAVDTSRLKEVRLGSRGSSDSRDSSLGAPMGLTKSNVQYRPRKDTVGDMIQRALGF